MIEIIQQVLIILFLFLMAERDSLTLKMMGNNYDSLTQSRKDKWHANSVFIYMVVCLPFAFWGTSFSHIAFKWELIVAAALLRVSLFDPALNNYMGWSLKAIGTTATWDKVFAKIFGADGAIKKSIAFLTILIILNVVYKIFN